MSTVVGITGLLVVPVYFMLIVIWTELGRRQLSDTQFVYAVVGFLPAVIIAAGLANLADTLEASR